MAGRSRRNNCTGCAPGCSLFWQGKDKLLCSVYLYKEDSSGQDRSGCPPLSPDLNVPCKRVKAACVSWSGRALCPRCMRFPLACVSVAWHTPDVLISSRSIRSTQLTVARRGSATLKVCLSSQVILTATRCRVHLI